MQHHAFAISDTCAAFGLKHVVICPGSRSAPLVYAFASDKRFTCYPVTDERSAGYFALGIAQQVRQPVVVISTSGTAALNLYPAIAEALYQKVPLLVLTADRPPRLLNHQNGQMINQQGVFEANILLSFHLLPSGEDKRAYQQTQALVSRALGICSGKPNGPVHINVPLHEPLYPETKTIKRPDYPAVTVKRTDRPLSDKNTATLMRQWNTARRKVILIGQYPPDNRLFTALYALSKQPDVVILADVLSNKQRVCTAPRFDFVLAHSDADTLRLLQPDMLISLGGPLVSKSLSRWLQQQKPEHHYRIQEEAFPVDTYGHVTCFLKTDPALCLTALDNNSLPSEEGRAYRRLWEFMDSAAHNALTAFTQKEKNAELAFTDVLLRNLPDAINLHLANSSVVRYVSLLGKLDNSWVMNGNRGTSGIDGCSSTAVGAAAVNNRLTVLITGDLGFLYDRNAFWTRHIPDNLRIVVINNNGGGIFTLIDGPDRNKDLLHYFTTPHHASIEHMVLDHGMGYYFCDSLSALESRLKTFFEPGLTASVLEIKTDMATNAAAFNRLKKIKL